MAEKNKKSKQKKSFSNADIAVLAHEIFMQEGCPHGRDQEHWLQAELILKSREDSQSSEK